RERGEYDHYGDGDDENAEILERNRQRERRHCREAEDHPDVDQHSFHDAPGLASARLIGLAEPLTTRYHAAKSARCARVPGHPSRLASLAPQDDGAVSAIGVCFTSVSLPLHRGLPALQKIEPLGFVEIGQELGPDRNWARLVADQFRDFFHR